MEAHQTSEAEDPGFESGISYNDPDALVDHCDKVENLRVEREKKILNYLIIKSSRLISCLI